LDPAHRLASGLRRDTSASRRRVSLARMEGVQVIALDWPAPRWPYHLPGQVRVPVPGGQLVNGHHTPVSTKTPAGSTRSRQHSWSRFVRFAIARGSRTDDARGVSQLGCCATGVRGRVTRWSRTGVQLGCGLDGQGREIGGRQGACRSLMGASREGCREIGAGWGVEPEGVQGLGKVGSWGPDLRVCGGAGVTDVACVAAGRAWDPR